MSEDTAARPESVRVPRFGLSGKLLVLTILFVMIAEVLIYVPSVANFRVTWLKDRLATGYTAALVLDAAPNGMVPDSLAKQILDSIGARAVAMKMGERRRMLAIDDMPPAVDDTFDMRSVSSFDAIVDAFKMMLNARPYVMRVVGPAPMGGEYIELIMDERPLRKAMLRYSGDILLLSLVDFHDHRGAGLSGAALHVRAPDAARHRQHDGVPRRSGKSRPHHRAVGARRRDRYRRARTRHHADRARLDAASEKPACQRSGSRCPRSITTCATCSPRRSCFPTGWRKIPDPGVQRFAPKLMHALERAIAFCQSTLSYGRVQEPPPDRRQILLEPLVEEVHETLGLGPDAPIRWISAVERGLVVEADYDQLFRILLNLSRNAVRRHGEPRHARSRPRPDPHHRPPRGRRGGDRGVRHRPGLFRESARRICSRRSRVRPAPAAPALALRSPPNWCAPMAATSAWSRAPSAPRCG